MTFPSVQWGGQGLNHVLLERLLGLPSSKLQKPESTSSEGLLKAAAELAPSMM